MSKVQEVANPKRRSVVKSLGLIGSVGVAAPEKWTRPVVEVILLPAHAQTTCVTEFDLERFFPSQEVGDTGQSCPDGQSIVFDDLIIDNCLDCIAEIVFIEAGEADDFLSVDGSALQPPNYTCGGDIASYENGFIVKSGITPGGTTRMNVRDIAEVVTGASGVIQLRCER